MAHGQHGAPASQRRGRSSCRTRWSDIIAPNRRQNKPVRSIRLSPAWIGPGAHLSGCTGRLGAQSAAARRYHRADVKLRTLGFDDSNAITRALQLLSLLQFGADRPTMPPHLQARLRDPATSVEYKLEALEQAFIFAPERP